MNKIKKYWKEIVIVILAILFLNKCTTSCSRQKIITSQEATIAQKDSTISVLNDSINALNMTIAIYTERTAGLESSIKIQEEAQKRLVEAKKQVQVTVKK